jgi:hypothetical protein
MLLDETGSAAGIFAWHRRGGTHHTSTSPFERTPSKPKPSLRQKVAKPRVVFTPLRARRKASGEPNFIACGSAIDPLQNEFEVGGQLELADHGDGRIIAHQRKQIAASDFTFDNEAEPFEESLDRSDVSRIVLPFRPSSKASFGRLSLQSVKGRPSSPAHDWPGRG